MTGLRRTHRSVPVLVAFVLGVCVGGSHEALRGLTGNPWNWTVMAVYEFLVWACLVGAAAAVGSDNA